MSTPSTDHALPDAVAARAVQDGIGFGNQGLQQGDVAEYQSTQTCGADWCRLFDTYQGKVPLELQTVFASDPDGSGQTGSLVSLMPFALQRHAQILEIYFVDWLTAFTPDYSNYTAYHASYAATFNSTADVLGFSRGGVAQQYYAASVPSSGRRVWAIGGVAFGEASTFAQSWYPLKKLARKGVGKRDRLVWGVPGRQLLLDQSFLSS